MLWGNVDFEIQHPSPGGAFKDADAIIGTERRVMKAEVIVEQEIRRLSFGE